MRETEVGFYHLGRVRVFQRDDETVKAQLFHQLAVVEGGLEQGFHLIVRILFHKGRGHRAAVHANA